MLHGNRVEIDAFQAADIDRRHTVALRIDTFCIRMDVENRAEAMLDNMLLIVSRRVYWGVTTLNLSRGTTGWNDSVEAPRSKKIGV